MKLKKIIFKGTIFIPLLSICYLFMEPIQIYIAAIDFDLWYGTSPTLFMIFTMLWLHFSPCRIGCKDGSIFELLFNLFPIEVLLAVIFAQYHFIISLLILACIMSSYVLFLYYLSNKRPKKDTDENVHLKNLKIGNRFFVMISSFMLIIPCFMAVFIYKLEDPYYEAREDIFRQLFASDDDAPSYQSEIIENTDFLSNFKSKQWNHCSAEEKITALQLLADYETNRLGVPSVPLSTERIDMFTLGAYNPKADTICIDIGHLENSEVEETIETMLHEVFHSYQDYVVTGIDWDSELANSAYFSEARAWNENNSNYIDGNLNYDAYESQPLEASARDFAQTESERLIALIAELQ